MEPRDLSDIAIEAFGEVAKLAAIQELKIRLLANKTKTIQDSAYEQKVSETNKRLIEHFKAMNALSDDDAELLQKSQTIRNKILHCEFNVAVKKIEELVGEVMPGPSVKLIRINPDADGSQILDSIFKAQEDLHRGTNKIILDADKLKDRELGIFGGLINCVQRGAMKAGKEIFEKSNDVLDRLTRIDTAFEGR